MPSIGQRFGPNHVSFIYVVTALYSAINLASCGLMWHTFGTHSSHVYLEEMLSDVDVCLFYGGDKPQFVRCSANTTEVSGLKALQSSLAKTICATAIYLIVRYFFRNELDSTKRTIFTILLEFLHKSVYRGYISRLG
jgi:hypothetical protein